MNAIHQGPWGSDKRDANILRVGLSVLYGSMSLRCERADTTQFLRQLLLHLHHVCDWKRSSQRLLAVPGARLPRTALSDRILIHSEFWFISIWHLLTLFVCPSTNLQGDVVHTNEKRELESLSMEEEFNTFEEWLAFKNLEETCEQAKGT